MNAIIRQAELKDANGIAKVHVKTWQCAYKGQIADSYLDSLSVEKRTKKWEENLTNPKPNVRTFVAELNNEIAGFASAGNARDKDMDSAGELFAIYVNQNFMHQGIGSALHKKSLEYLKELNYKKAMLWVLTSNENSRKWYESKGWKMEGKTKIEETGGAKLKEARYIIEL